MHFLFQVKFRIWSISLTFSLASDWLTFSEENRLIYTIDPFMQAVLHLLLFVSIFCVCVRLSVSVSALLSPAEYRPLPYRRGYSSLLPSSHTFPASLTEREIVFPRCNSLNPGVEHSLSYLVIHPLHNQPQEPRKWRWWFQPGEIHHTVIWAETVQYKFLKL